MTAAIYEAQFRLLLRVLPYVAMEEAFALKGGTAINLFLRDLPRLSVDIDLVYLPLETREASLIAIGERLATLRERLLAVIPRIEIPEPQGAADNESRLTCRLDGASIKIEVNTVLRGAAWPPRSLTVRDVVAQEFGLSASISVLSTAELWGGKLAAALDRQHPRDLFDVRGLFAQEGLTPEIMQGFVVALASHGRPMHELLRPHLIAQSSTFDNQFAGMARESFSYAEFEATRARLVADVSALLTSRDREFLLSLKRGEPDWSLAPAPTVELLPGVQWKLHNIRQLAANKTKHRQQLARLQAALEVKRVD